MGKLKYLILLIIFPLVLIACSKDDNGNSHQPGGEFKIKGTEYNLTGGVITCMDEDPDGVHRFRTRLYSSGISFNADSGLAGIGDLLDIVLTAQSQDSPEPGTYSINTEDYGPGYFKMDCYIWAGAGKDELHNFYRFTSGTLILKKEGNEYEFTIKSTGNEINFLYYNEIIDDVKIDAYYKGSLNKYLITKQCNNYIITGDRGSGCIRYIDFEPDKYITPEYWEGDAAYSYDVQGNGVPDFVFITSRWSYYLGESSRSKIFPLDGNSIICSTAEEDLAAKFNVDTIINSSGSWSSEELTLAYEYINYEIESSEIVQEYSRTTGGEWLSEPDSGYLGLRITANFDTIYAWVLLSAGTGWIYIREYAYQEK